mgnify:CR=1 FL=1
MPRLVAVLLLLFIATTASAQPSLLGTWQSSAERSAAFNRQNAKLEERTHLFLEQLLGHSTMVFTRTHVQFDMPDVETISTEGKASLLKGFSERYRYRTLSTTATQVTVEGKQPVTGTRAVTVFNFEDANTMWVYLSTPDFPRLHAREYFVRVQLEVKPAQ